MAFYLVKSRTTFVKPISCEAGITVSARPRPGAGVRSARNVRTPVVFVLPNRWINRAWARGRRGSS